MDQLHVLTDLRNKEESTEYVLFLGHFINFKTTEGVHGRLQP